MPLKKIYCITSLAAAVLASAGALNAQTVYSTGTDASNNPTPSVGSQDLHWNTAGDGPAYVISRNGAWASSSSAQWIWSNAAGNSNSADQGTQTFFQTFTLSAAEAGTGASLSGQWGTDNRGTLSLNGCTSTSSTYSSLSSFSFGAGCFVSGENTLTASVINDGGPGGVLVAASFTAGSATVTPEPGSLALLGTGLIGLAPMVRRRNR